SEITARPWWPMPIPGPSWPAWKETSATPGRIPRIPGWSGRRCLEADRRPLANRIDGKVDRLGREQTARALPQPHQMRIALHAAHGTEDALLSVNAAEPNLASFRQREAGLRGVAPGLLMK